MGNDNERFEQARSHFRQGIAHFEAGRLDVAEVEFRASLALLPGRPSTLANLGATLVKLQRNEEALAILDQALAAEPDEVEALGHRSYVLNQMGRHEEALGSLERFVALRPDRPEGWFNLGQTLQVLGRHQPALGAYERTLALAPGHAQAWSNRGGALKELGRDPEAAASFERALEFGADAELNRYYLASIRGDDVPPVAPRMFVRNLFDSYVQGFDQHLVGTLGYRAPERLAQLVVQQHPAAFRSAIDLGCGTGLCGTHFRPLAGRLEGVDLSAPMLATAAARKLYDELVEAEITEHLAHTTRRHDLAIAADVLIYIGDLDAVFAGVARVLDRGGVFAFSTEIADDDHDFRLQPSMRYAQSERYLRQLAERHRLQPSLIERGVLRRDREHEVSGFYGVFVRGE